MSAPEMAELAAKSKRRVRIGWIVLGLVVGGLPCWIAISVLDIPPVPAMITIVSLGLGTMIVPCRVDKEMKLTTGKPPEEVRSDFLRVNMPLRALNCQRADDIQNYENGAELTFNHPIWSSQSVYFETETRPDGSIVVHSDQNDDPTVIDIVDDGENTIVVADISAQRINLAVLVPKYLISPYQNKALQLQGYEIVDSKTEYSIL